MARRRGPGYRTTVLGVAGGGGVVLAHVVDYVLLFRSPSQRAAVLAETGHAVWPSALVPGAVATGLAVGMALTGAAASDLLRRPARPARGAAWPQLAGLALWQAGLFCVVEVVERVGAHRSPLTLLHGPLLPAGILCQLVVAAALLGLLALTERVGAKVVAAALAGGPRRRGARRPVFGAPAVRRMRRAGGPGRAEPRGPPPGLAA